MMCSAIYGSTHVDDQSNNDEGNDTNVRAPSVASADGQTRGASCCNSTHYILASARSDCAATIKSPPQQAASSHYPSVNVDASLSLNKPLSHYISIDIKQQEDQTRQSDHVTAACHESDSVIVDKHHEDDHSNTDILQDSHAEVEETNCTTTSAAHDGSGGEWSCLYARRQAANCVADGAPLEDELVEGCNVITLSPPEVAVVALKQEDYIPYDYDAALNECEYSDAMLQDGLDDDDASAMAARWDYVQERQNALYHADKKGAWIQHMAQEATLTAEQYTCAVKALLAEACQRDLRRLACMPICAFENATLYAQQPLSLASLRLLLVQPGAGQGGSDASASTPSSASVAAARKRAYIAQVQQQWQALKHEVQERLDEMSAPTMLRCLMSNISTLTLFNGNPFHVIRELNCDLVEEQRRQRRLRAERLLQSLAEQGRLFVLPTLYAEEVVPPTPVPPLSVAVPVDVNGLGAVGQASTAADEPGCLSLQTSINPSPQLSEVLLCGLSQTLFDEDGDEDVSGVSAGETVSSANSSKSHRSSLCSQLDSPSSRPCDETLNDPMMDISVECATEQDWLTTLDVAQTMQVDVRFVNDFLSVYEKVGQPVTPSVARCRTRLDFAAAGESTMWLTPSARCAAQSRAQPSDPLS